jgi:hypothetical protein
VGGRVEVGVRSGRYRAQVEPKVEKATTKVFSTTYEMPEIITIITAGEGIMKIKKGRISPVRKTPYDSMIVLQEVLISAWMMKI